MKNNSLSRLLLILIIVSLAVTGSAQNSISRSNIRHISQKNSSNSYTWIVYLSASPNQLSNIKEVTYLLHSTYKDSVIRIQRFSQNGTIRLRQISPTNPAIVIQEWDEPAGKPFGYSAKGWGNFAMRIHINYRDGSPRTSDFSYYIDLDKSNTSR